MKKLLHWSLIPTTIVVFSGCIPAVNSLEPTPTSTLIVYMAPPTVTDSFELGLPATQMPSGPTATPFTHVVQQGETLLGIAIRYGVTLDDLLLVNPGVDPRILSVGQNISIPGPGGEPINLLLPTPTAIPLELGNAHCYPTVAENMRCLLKVTNTLDSTVEGVTLSLSLYDSAGTLIGQSKSNTLNRFLRPGQSSLVHTTFQSGSVPQFSLRSILISAVQVSSLENRYFPIQIKELEVERSDDRLVYEFSGILAFVDEAPVGQIALTMQIFGYNTDAEPVGLNALQLLIDSEEFPVSFQLPLLSLAGGIEEFEILVEAQPRGGG